jgi:hypothetical protein
LDAGVDRLYEMGTYSNHSGKGGLQPGDRENVTRQLLEYPLNNTAFGLGDYKSCDNDVETAAWLGELQERSKDMPGQLTVHVYDLFGGTHGEPGGAPEPPGGCMRNASVDSRYCARPPPLWWPVFEQFHGGGGGG